MAKKNRNRNDGSLHQRPDGSWRAQIYHGGKRLSYSNKSKAECQRWLRERLSELDRGYDLFGGTIPLGDYLLDWLSKHRMSLRPNTAYQYENAIRRHIIPHIGQIAIGSLHPRDLENFYADQIQAGTGVRTVRLAHAIIHCALNTALRYDLILRNPGGWCDTPEKTEARDARLG
jgi:integrase